MGQGRGREGGGGEGGETNESEIRDMNDNRIKEKRRIKGEKRQIEQNNGLTV